MLASPLQRPIFDKCIGQRLTHYYRTMVAQHQYPLVAQMFNKAHPFFLAHRNPFEIMIRQLPHEVAGIEIHGLQPTFKAANGHGRGGMSVDDRMRVGQSPVKQTMLDKARLVHMPWIVDVNLVAINVDFNKARCGYLTEVHAIRINQKRTVFVRHLDRDMVKNQLIPTKHRKYPVTGSKLLPRSPFCFAIFAV